MSDTIEKLDDLLAAGLIQREEYDSRRAALLPSPPPVSEASKPLINNAPGPGTFRKWFIPATPGGSEKPMVSAEQQDDCYVFTPRPCSSDITVEVVVNEKQVKFHFSTQGNLVQTFNMPFDIGCEMLEADGDKTRVKFPW